MDVRTCKLEGVLLITPPRFDDPRGFFSESYNRLKLAALGLDIEFVQDNHSLSCEVGTVRGLHFQAPPCAQAKLVRCGRGALFDVAVDIRSGSPTFGQWVGYELSFENGTQLFIPQGFAHGFMTLQADTEIVYKCSEYYSPDTEGSLYWSDPDININWPLNDIEPIISDKDGKAPLLREFSTPFNRVSL